MASASEIRFNFQQSLKRAEELEEVAEGLKRLAQGDLESAFQNLSLAWKGEAASAYLEKGSRLEEKILKSAKDLNSTASAIRRIAQRTYEAEMRTYRLAKERNYGKS